VNAILFVQFKDAAKATPLGFSTEYPYPVYHIDAVESTDGSLCAQFLLANREGNFCWIDQCDVKRVKGQPQGQNRPNGSGRFAQRRYGNGNGGNKRYDRPQRKDEPSPYPPQEQYVEPQAEPQES